MPNTLSLIRYGRYKTSPESDYGEIASGQLRGCMFDALSVNTWFTDIGIWAGKNTGTDVTATLAIYEEDASIDPDSRVARTDSFQITASKTDNTGGQSYEQPIFASSGSPVETSGMGYAGVRYGVGVLATVGSLNHSMRQASAITADNEQFYNRSGLSQPAPDPFGSATASTQGHMTAWVSGWQNVPPEIPIPLTPSGTVTSVTPAITATFQDLNGAYGDSSGDGVDTGDRMKTYRMRVRRKSDGVYFWSQTITATNTEKTNNAINITYAGTALTRGVEYEWRVQIADEFGEYSDWSPWTSFTPVGLGYITLDSTPTGKQEAITGITFYGRWNHQTSTSMKEVQLRLLNANGDVLQAPAAYNIADVPSAALPGELFAVSWANTGFTDLSWGTDYQYQMRGYDGTAWSEWSDTRTFNTNAAPAIPTLLVPSGSQVFTDYPLLYCSITDEDAEDTYATDLEGIFRIYGPYVVNNGDFASDVTGWTVSTDPDITRALSYDASVYNTAAGSAKLNISVNGSTAGDYIDILNDTYEPCIAGETYTGRVSTRTDNVNITPRTIISWYTAANALISTSVEDDWTPTADTWSDRSLTATAPATAAKMKIGVRAYCDTGGPTGNIWADDFLFDNGARYDRSPTYSLTTLKWEYQTDGTDLEHHGSYTFKAVGFDGTLYSGDATAIADAAWSSESAFVYQTGPSVTVTSPTNSSTLTSSEIDITWTTTDQVSYQVFLYENDTSTVVYDSTEVISGTGAHTIPVGYAFNETNYDLVVKVTNSVDQDGYSSIVNIYIEFPAVDPVSSFSASPIIVKDDPLPSAIRLSWEQTSYPENEFSQYIIRRSAASGPDQSQIILRRLTSPSTISYTDYTPASGVEYTYTISTVIIQDGQEVVSSVQTTTESITIQGVVLTRLTNGGTHRAYLPNVRERSHKRNITETVYKSLKYSTPLTIRNKTWYWETMLTGYLFDTVESTAIEKANNLLSLDEQNSVVCYRDGRSIKRFCRIADLDIKDEMPDYYSYTIKLREERVSEGVW